MDEEATIKKRRDMRSAPALHLGKHQAEQLSRYFARDWTVSMRSWPPFTVDANSS